MRAPKDVFYKLQFFVEQLHGGVYGAILNIPLVRSYLPTCKGYDVSTSRLFKLLAYIKSIWWRACNILEICYSYGFLPTPLMELFCGEAPRVILSLKHVYLKQITNVQ
jgi:hypothetical protein